MSANKDQKRQKDNPQEKAKQENKKFTPPGSNNPKPFQQFSNPNKFGGGPPKSYNAFHRRLGK
ncbi:MAG: hypothetical protein HY094_10425 [Candidatus Melainabacteria bacterium]|nr:hypothetical protein [Candidatus Melainabacteria bacterium]